jgi:hypothetical protein
MVQPARAVTADQSACEGPDNQFWSLQPLPALPNLDLANCRICDTELVSHFSLENGAAPGPDICYLLAGKLRRSAFLTPLRSTVVDHLRHVFGMCFPSEVKSAHASKMAIAAGVSRFVRFCRGWTILVLANHSSHAFHSRPVPQHRRAAAFSIGPEQAISLVVMENHVFEKRLRLSERRSVCCVRVACCPPASPMHGAPSAPLRGLVAGVD